MSALPANTVRYLASIGYRAELAELDALNRPYPPGTYQIVPASEDAPWFALNGAIINCETKLPKART